MGHDTHKLLDVRSNDGWRQFAEIPDRVGNSGWEGLRGQIAAAPGVVVTDFLSDGVTQAIADFEYRGHQFTIDTQFGEFWLFVEDPTCPPGVLFDVISLVQKLQG